MAATAAMSPSTISPMVLLRLRDFIEDAWPDAAGFDPYDALNSPLIRLVSAPNRHLRIAWTQLLRHLPWNLRPLFGIRRHRNPKTISLLARAYLRLSLAGGPDAETAAKRARSYLEWLAANAARGFAGAAWGYSFPWQSTRLCLDRGQPSVVCTAFVAQAFLDAYAAWSEEQHLAVGRSAAEFLWRDCPRHESASGSCISYLPSASVWVHNANVLAASILAQVWRASGRAIEPYRLLAERSAAFTLAEQRADGAWYYDAPPGPVQPVVDGFHTGFVLEGLDAVGQALGVDYTASIARGLEFYCRRLIDPSGRPYRNVEQPDFVDVRDCAEALLVLERFADDPAVAAARAAVLRWTIAHLYDQRGFFYYEHGGWSPIRNRIPYPRWQAWMLLALAPGPKRLAVRGLVCL